MSSNPSKPDPYLEWEYAQNFRPYPYYNHLSFFPPPNYLDPALYFQHISVSHKEHAPEDAIVKVEEAFSKSMKEYSPESFPGQEVMSQKRSKKSKKQKQKAPKPRAPRPQKNVQSNISNQVFSFLFCEKKSRQAIFKITDGNQEKVNAFYSYMKCLTKYKRKYLNRKYLRQLCTLNNQSNEYRDFKQKNSEEKVMKMDELRYLISSLIFHFLRSKCNLTILASSKMCSKLRIQHMERRRDILNYLEEYVKPDLYLCLH